MMNTSRIIPIPASNADVSCLGKNPAARPHIPPASPPPAAWQVPVAPFSTYWLPRAGWGDSRGFQGMHWRALPALSLCPGSSTF